MFLLGILSVLQITLLPGLLILKLSGFRDGFTRALLLSFGTSLMANYLIVTILVSSGAYHQLVILALILLESIAVLWLYRSDLIVTFARPAHPLFNRGFVFVCALLLAADSLVWALYRFLRDLGTVFKTWDAVVSWNRWALVWARGAIPHDIQYYPQLIPSNWSLTYVLMQNEDVQAFAKASTGLCLVYILFLLLDLGVRTESYGVLLGVVFTALLTRKCAGEFIGDGYVDLPVAFFAILSACVLLLPNDDKSLWFSCAAAAGAALTKQSGLYFFLIWPLLPLGTAAIRRVRAWLICAIPPAAFYARQWLLIRQGRDSSNIAYLTHDIYHGASLSARAVHAFQSLGVYTALFVLASLALPVLPRAYRRLTLFVVIPFTAIWALFFSYDNRNIMLAVPFAGLVAGVAVEGIAGRLLPRFVLRKVNLAVPIALVALVLVGLAAVLTRDRIVANQLQARKEAFCPPLNERLYQYFGSHPRQGRIVTDYPLNFLPGFEGSVYLPSPGDPNAFERVPDAAYLLVPGGIAKRFSGGQYEHIFDVSSDCQYSFFKIVRK